MAVPHDSDEKVKDAVIAFGLSIDKFRVAGASLRERYGTYTDLLRAAQVVKEIIVSQFKVEWRKALRALIPPQNSTEDSCTT